MQILRARGTELVSGSAGDAGARVRSSYSLKAWHGHRAFLVLFVIAVHLALVAGAGAAVINSATFDPPQQDLLKGATGTFQLVIDGQVTASDVAQGVIRFNINRFVAGSNFDDQLIRVRAPCPNAVVLQNFRAVVDFGLRCKADCSLEGAGITSIVFTDTSNNQIICQSGQAADTGGSGTGTENPHMVIVEDLDGFKNVGSMEVNCLAQQDCGHGLCGYLGLPLFPLTLVGILAMKRCVGRFRLS